MRYFILLLSFFALNLQAKDVELKTTIKEVTVFQAGAQVKRTGSVKIPAGESEIKISDATSLLKEESIQVKGEGNFTIISVNYQARMEDLDNEKSKWDALEAKKKTLMQQLEDLSVKIQVLNSRETAILNLKNTSTTTKGVTVEQIAKAQELTRLKLAEIKNEKLADARLILEMFDEHKQVSQHLLALKTVKKQMHYEIVIKVSAKAEVNGDFEISYVVPNARWYPSYDIRVKNISEPMSIEYKANVTQESGEDWNNIKLKLSTGDPSRSVKKPEIEAWWLYLNRGYVQPGKAGSFYNYTSTRFTNLKGTIVDDETGEPIPWCNVTVSGTNVGVMADGDGKFSLLLPGNASRLYVQSIGFEGKYETISEKNMTIKLHKIEMILSETIKTDYEKDLITLNPPIVSTDGDMLPKLTVSGETFDRVFGGNTTEQLTLDGAYGAGAADMTQSYNYVATRSETYSAAKTMEDKVAYNVTTTKTLNIVSTEFAIEQAYSIPSDPKNISVSIQSINTNAKYQYYCAPRLDKDVFLTAQLIDWEQYNLLEGQANVFFEGTFIGNTFLDTRYLVDTLEISLGRDKGVKVERKKSKDYNKRQVIGSDNIASRDWDITIRNAKQQPVDILIEDQFPVSADGKVTVTPEEYSGGKLNETTGVVSWPLKMDPSSTKELQLRYKVKYPKGNFVGLD
ncbi:MAG: mucoidy inhibitor MuiA family protein [Bacteroidia bacterium]